MPRLNFGAVITFLIFALLLLAAMFAAGQDANEKDIEKSCLTKQSFTVGELTYRCELVGEGDE